MNFTRSTLLVAGAAFLAACGDKVSVQSYTPTTPTPVVNSVSVAPATATLTVGQTITLTAAVNADAGLATTVSWSSSDATKASVSSAGVVTAVAATPGVAICAASTVDAGKKGCASIVVSAPAPVQPASVSINSITVNGTNGTTVNPSNVAGNIDVTLNVNPGNQQVSKIVLIVGGIRQDSQTFTAAQAAALRYSADQAVAAQSTFPQVLFSVNTAAYNATTGAPRWTNGSKGISAQLYTVAGGTATAATATAQTNLTFNNVDGFQVSTTQPSAGVVDANGYRWYGNGSLVVSAIPVMYSGASVGTVTAALGGACGAVGGTATSASSSTAPYSITLALTGSQSPAGCATTTPNVVTITATNANGDVLTLGGTNGVLNTIPGLRWDNVGPAVPTIDVSTGGTRANNWINAAVVLNARRPATGTSNNIVTNGTASTKVGGIGGALTWQAQIGTVGTAVDGGIAAANAAATVTDASGIANSLTNATYCLVVRSVDLLGNKSTAPTAAGSTNCTVAAAGTQQIGVDKIAPGITVTSAAGSAKSLRMFTTGGVNYSYTLSDTSLNAAAANITVKTTAIRFGGTAAADTQTVTTTVAPPTNTLSQAHPVAVTGGYWTVSATANDQAGNSVAITPYIYLYDAAAAAVSNALQTNAGLTAGGAENFFATGTDNVDLDSAYVTHTYADGAAAAYPFILTQSKVQASPFTAGAPIKSTTINGTWTAGMPRAVGTVASGAAISTLNLGAFGTAVNFFTTDQTTGSTGTLDAGSTANAQNNTLYTAVNGPAAAAWANSYTASTVTIANKRTTLNQAAGTGKIVSDTITVTVSLAGQATPITSNAFTRAELYIRTNNATATGAAAAASHGLQLLSALTPVVVYDGQAQTATWTYTYVFTPGTAFKAGLANYVFVGYDSKSNAAATPSAAAFTIAP